MSTRLHEARTVAGISARHLDSLAGFPPGQTAKIENGQRANISAAFARDIATALGVSLDWLVSGLGGIATREAILAAVAKAERATTRSPARAASSG